MTLDIERLDITTDDGALGPTSHPSGRAWRLAVDCRCGPRWRAPARRLERGGGSPPPARNLTRGREPLAREMSAWPTTASAVRGFHRAGLSVSPGRPTARSTGSPVAAWVWAPKPGRWGTLRLTTTGRRTGRPRSVIVGYFQDGPNLVTLAMNGWADPEPAWWLNLQTQPDATVELAGEARAVRARAAQGAERSRLWARWSDIDRQLDGYAAKRSSPTAVVILEPRPAAP